MPATFIAVSFTSFRFGQHKSKPLTTWFLYVDPSWDKSVRLFLTRIEYGFSSLASILDIRRSCHPAHALHRGMLVLLHSTQEEPEVQETERRQDSKDECKVAKDTSEKGVDWQEASSQGHIIWKPRYRRTCYGVGTRDISRSTTRSARQSGVARQESRSLYWVAQKGGEL